MPENEFIVIVTIDTENELIVIVTVGIGQRMSS